MRTQGAALGIAICLWALIGQQFGITLIYSLCISTMCWLFIDVGRAVVAARLQRSVPARARTASASGQWPGWIWMLVIVAVGAVLGYAAGNEIANRITGLNLPGPFNANPRQTLSLLVMALVPAVTITYFFQSREVIATQKAEVERAERQAAEQQLKLLESQLEPHMLFNTLANLRALIGVDPPRAQPMLDHLIAFLRASLAGSRAGAQTLAAEFDRLRDYLALMEVRMGARLATRFDAAARARRRAGAAVPAPAARREQHQARPRAEARRRPHRRERGARGRCARAARSRHRRRRGGGAVPGDGGFGLGHVRERLATLYGAGARSFDAGRGRRCRRRHARDVRLPLGTRPPAERRSADRTAMRRAPSSPKTSRCSPATLEAELAALWPELEIVAVVGDGEAAVEQALALRPDVCFLDIRMPGMSGLEAAQALAEDWPDDGTPFPLVVFVTAYDQYALQAFERAAVDYVLKPVEPARLAQTCAAPARSATRCARARAAASAAHCGRSGRARRRRRAAARPARRVARRRRMPRRSSRCA